MSFASFVMVMLFAGSVSPTVPSSHADHLKHGRSVVESMLVAVEQQDQSAFGRLVKEDALFVVGEKAAPAGLQMIPSQLDCQNPRVTKVEPSENVVGDSRVTVAWTCKPRLPDFDGNLAIRFWVHGGKVIFGERV